MWRAPTSSWGYCGIRWKQRVPYWSGLTEINGKFFHYLPCCCSVISSYVPDQEWARTRCYLGPFQRQRRRFWLQPSYGGNKSWKHEDSSNKLRRFDRLSSATTEEAVWTVAIEAVEVAKVDGKGPFMRPQNSCPSTWGTNFSAIDTTKPGIIGDSH